MEYGADFFAGCPPLLSESQLLQLGRQGWLTYPLPEDMADTVADLFKSSSQFFDRPDQEKRHLYPAKSETEFGYYPVPGEKEYITFRCRSHTSPDSQSEEDSQLQSLENVTAKMWHRCGLLLLRILCDLAHWSKLPPTVWTDILDGTLTMPDTEEQKTYTLLRLFSYLPTTGFAESHSDLGLLTICIGDRGGLEVLDLAQSSLDKPVWINPADNANTITILAGQTLKALSGGAFKPGVHRVVGTPQGRCSIVFALRHSTRHDVDFGLFGREGIVEPSDLWKSIKIGKVNVNMIKEKREAQRAQNAKLKLEQQPPSDTSIG